MTEPVRAPTGPAEAERRQLTVVFCDLVGFTGLAARLDPEALRDVVRSYQQVCDAVVGQHHGHVAQYLGDGLLVYFGYPIAREDDPRRAVRAAVGIIEALAPLNTRLQRERGITLAVRIGIHTGPVVVGEIGGASRREALALGDTPNVAARLQAIAEPDTVVISAATRRLLQATVAVTDLGVQAFKGLPLPVRAYRVDGDGGVATSSDAAAEIVTPLVGREEEVGLLLGRWEHVRDGRGHAVLLNGEPGIGKSRLVRVLTEHIGTERALRWECRCSAYHQDSALYPLIDLFERELQFDRDDTPAQRLTKLEAGLARHPPAPPEALSLWAAFLSLPLDDRGLSLNLTPQRQKEKTFEAIAAFLLALAAEQPLLLTIEDLHWADPSTLGFIDLVLGQVPATAILLLMTARPEFRPPWTPHGHLTSLTVNRMTRRQTELMIERVTGGKGLPTAVLQQIVAKTDGVPLFVEELTRMVIESDLLHERGGHYELVDALPSLAIPSTLQDSLMARLDRLAAFKDVAQVGAALGRSFHYELLRAVAALDDAPLQRALARLGASDLLHQRGMPPDATYVFKHALIQETAYQSMLVSRRRQLHERIGDTLVERFAEVAGMQPEVVAHHYTEAGRADPAIDYWQRAGQRAVERAVERSANLEGIAHLTKALSVLAALPVGRERLERELVLRTALGPALMSTKGLGSPEVGQNYSQALELCRQLGERPELFAVLRGLWEFHELRGELTTALALGEELIRLAQAADDPALRVVAHDVLAARWRQPERHDRDVPRHARGDRAGDAARPGPGRRQQHLDERPQRVLRRDGGPGRAGRDPQAAAHPLVAPPGGVKAALGTNPIAFGFPLEGDPLVIDLGTSAFMGTDLQFRQRLGLPLPEDVAIDEHGRPTTEATAARRGALLPFGGHKGYALALAMHALGVLSHGVTDPDRGGYLLIAFRPGLFMPLDDYRHALAAEIAALKATPRQDGVEEIRIPGERAYRERARLTREGIEIDRRVHDALLALAKDEA